jgi:hypothetical protein
MGDERTYPYGYKSIAQPRRLSQQLNQSAEPKISNRRAKLTAKLIIVPKQLIIHVL